MYNILMYKMALRYLAKYRLTNININIFFVEIYTSILDWLLQTVCYDRKFISVAWMDRVLSQNRFHLIKVLFFGWKCLKT